MAAPADQAELRRFVERLYPRVLTPDEVIGKLLRDLRPEHIPEAMGWVADEIRQALRERIATYPSDDGGWGGVQVPWLYLTMDPIPEEQRARDRLILRRNTEALRRYFHRLK